MFLLGGCASTELGERTGIVLPPEPEVAVPNFAKLDKVQITDLNPTGETVPRAVPKVKTKRKKRKKIEEKPVRVFKVEDLPFEMGEELKLSLRWMMLPAGTASLKVVSGEFVKGRPTVRLTGRLLSSVIVDTIYHVDNRIDVLIDREALFPYRFLLSMLETHQKKETRVKFDHVSKVAHYQANRKSAKWGNKVEDRKDVVPKYVKDMYTALYYARTLDYALGRTEVLDLYENGKNMQLKLTPVGTELVVSSLGAFQCLKIRVQLALNNVLKPMGDVFIWLSDDSKKYIVKFDAKIKIGSLNGLLIGIKEKS